MSAASANPATAGDKQTEVSLVDLAEQVRRRAYEPFESHFHDSNDAQRNAVRTTL